MSKFNVTRVCQDGFLHHAAMADLQDSIAWALSELGHTANCTLNWFSEHQETNIILCPEFIADFQRLPANSIVFNLEQPGHPLTPKVKRLVRESNAVVWDYSQRSTQAWRDEGFTRVHHVPIGYTPNLTRIPPAAVQDIDVLFFGWMTERRRAILEQLIKSGLSVHSSAACYGGGRDQLISRAKVCLNLHHDGRDRFEIVRCSLLMANSKCVVTEPSSDDDEYEHLRYGMITVPARLMVDFVHSLAQHDKERIRIEQYAFEAIQRCPFADSIRAALDTEPDVAVPTIGRPLEVALNRQHAKRGYLQQGRDLSSDPVYRVQQRFERAKREGDMRDFVGWLYSHARGNILEIGVRDGASTSALLRGVEDHGGHVTSIDIVDCGHLFAGHPQWTFEKVDSHGIKEMADGFAPNDLILIDGDHSREGFRQDLELCWTLVKPGGLIACHDIRPEKTYENFGGDWPSVAVGEEYSKFWISHGCEHQELPGYSGMGVITKPLVQVCTHDSGCPCPDCAAIRQFNAKEMAR